MIGQNGIIEGSRSGEEATRELNPGTRTGDGVDIDFTTAVGSGGQASFRH